MLFLDSSALVKRYVVEAGTDDVLAAMQEDPEWTASAVALVETQIALCRHAGMATRDDLVMERLADDWERFRVVPSDAACLLRASAIGCEQRIRTLDAIHLAAADRLPRPLTFLTFDRRQAVAARTLGIDVVGVTLPSPVAATPGIEE